MARNHGHDYSTSLLTLHIQLIHKGPFIIYDRGWAGKIELTTKQNVRPHPVHHKKIQ